MHANKLASCGTAEPVAPEKLALGGQDLPGLESNFFEEAILTRPGENLIETVRGERASAQVLASGDTQGNQLQKAQEIANEVIAKHDAELAWPKLMHMSAGRRNDKYFLPLALAAEAAKGASLVETYEAADLIRAKYAPQYKLGAARAPKFS